MCKKTKYVIGIQIFNWNFVNNLWQAPGDYLWPTKVINRNYKTRLLHHAKYLLGMNKAYQYSMVKSQTKSGQKWEWSRRWRVWVAYFKIWCKLRCTNRTEKKNTRIGGGGAKNAITIGISRRKRLRKWGWKIFWVM